MPNNNGIPPHQFPYYNKLCFIVLYKQEHIHLKGFAIANINKKKNN